MCVHACIHDFMLKGGGEGVLKGEQRSKFILILELGGGFVNGYFRKCAKRLCVSYSHLLKRIYSMKTRDFPGETGISKLFSRESILSIEGKCR